MSITRSNRNLILVLIAVATAVPMTQAHAVSSNIAFEGSFESVKVIACNDHVCGMSNASQACGSGWSGLNVDANHGAGGDYVYVCFNRAETGDAVVNRLNLIYLSYDPYSFWFGVTPSELCNQHLPIYGVETPWKGDRTNLNSGAGGDYIYLCYGTTYGTNAGVRRIRMTRGTTDSATDSECLSLGGSWMVTTHETNGEGNLNKGAGGQKVKMCRTSLY